MTNLESVNEFCFKLLDDFMNEEVAVYRNKLGFHFDFDFKFMLFVRPTNEVQNKLYGHGIRVRHNLFDRYLYSIKVDDYIVIKDNIYNKNKPEIKNKIREFNPLQFSLLLNEDESNELNVDMSKYYQIFVIEHQERIIDYLEKKFNGE